jgi:hypothetical protein
MRQLFIIVIGFAVISQTVHAQMSPQQVRDICMPDIRVLCEAELATRDRAKVRACLIAKRQQASPSCQAALRAANTPPKKSR